MSTAAAHPALPASIGARRAGPKHSGLSLNLAPLPFPALLLAATGFLLGLELEIVGRLYAGELLLAFLAIFVLLGGLRRADPALWRFLGIFAVSLTAWIIADIVNQTPIENALRGWARLAFVMTSLITLRYLLRKSRANMFPLLAGFLLANVILKGELPLNVLWKYNASTLFILTGLYLLAWTGRRFSPMLSAVFLAATAFASLSLDTRAAAGMCLLAAAIVTARVILKPRFRALFPFILVLATVGAMALGGVFQQQAGSQYEHRQGISNGIRVASLITAAQTIAEHPLVGMGSWAQDFEAANRHRENAGLSGITNDTETFNQAGHSAIMQAWSEAGFFAALALIYYLWRILASLRHMMVRPVDALYAPELFILISGLWNCLFSPFGGATRFYMALTAAVCIALSDEMAPRLQ